MSAKRNCSVKWDPDRLAARVAELSRRLAPDVIRIRCELGDDWSGGPAIFFRVLLADLVCRGDRLHPFTEHARSEIETGLGLNLWVQGPPLWMPFPHFTWRSESEQRQLKEKSWE